MSKTIGKEPEIHYSCAAAIYNISHRINLKHMYMHNYVLQRSSNSAGHHTLAAL